MKLDMSLRECRDCEFYHDCPFSPFPREGLFLTRDKIEFGCRDLLAVYYYMLDVKNEHQKGKVQ